jgi:spore maturation protein CgeB
LAGNPIGAQDRESICIANTPEEFIALIDELLTDHDFYAKIARNGQEFVRTHYSWSHANAQLIEMMSHAQLK